jgi:hypothetical protein
VIGSDDDWTSGRYIAKTFYLGAEEEHQEWGQECSQGAVWQVVHGDNLLQGACSREYMRNF